MVALYALAHVVMTRTALGRYIYAVGGNAQAARLSGVRVGWVLLFVYTVCGALAGLGGVVMASRLKSGAPDVRADVRAVRDRRGRRRRHEPVRRRGQGARHADRRLHHRASSGNGMNLTNVSFDTQKVVLGLVLLGAVLLDATKRKNWRAILSSLWAR